MKRRAASGPAPERVSGVRGPMNVFALLAALAVSVAITPALAQDPTPAPQDNAPRQGPEPAAAPKPETARPAPPVRAVKPSSSEESICLMMESAATANGLPLDFFVRVIWRESSFRAEAVGPVTRNGQRAQGIAQFMPGTAAARGLLDPFDPVQALPKSAEYLRDLRREFGNLGLAAAAYNGGPRRVQDWLAGRGGLPDETRRYVLAVTGRSAEEWAAAGRDSGAAAQSGPTATCMQLAALVRSSKTPFLTALERHVREGAAQPWGVQLSAGFSRDRALASYAAIERKYRAILAGRDPSILRVRLLSRGTRDFYQVRVGANSRETADKLCASLRAAGGACLVLRNTPGAPKRTG